MNNITFVDTTLRDAHQSMWNGQMTTAMMLPIAPTIDKVGFEALDFMALISMDWCIRNLKENPWDRLKLMSKSHAQYTPDRRGEYSEILETSPIP
jgi:oxaloacetate decarboxylase alpha subunit